MTRSMELAVKTPVLAIVVYMAAVFTNINPEESNFNFVNP